MTPRKPARRIGRLIIAFSALMGALPWACAPSAADRAPEVITDTGQPALHAVYGDVLKAAMRELDYRASDHVFMQLYTGSTPAIDMQRVRSAADAIATTSAGIPEALSASQLSPEERHVFDRLAAKLRDEALQLAEHARRQDVDAARDSVRRLTSTCNACHSTFRIPPAGVNAVQGTSASSHR